MRRLTASIKTSNSSKWMSKLQLSFNPTARHTQTSNRTTYWFPKCQEETYRGERFFSPTQGTGIFLSLVCLRRLIVSLHFQNQLSGSVVEQEFAKVTTLRKVILEHNLCPEGNMPPEILPPGVTVYEGFLQSLSKRSANNHHCLRRLQAYLIEHGHCSDINTCTVILFFGF